MRYVKLAYKELVEKVSWPSWSELQSSAIVVMVTCVLFALVIAAMDGIFDFTMDTVYHFFKN